MIHLGDITKISGHTAPIVDCIIGGSPCQGLSQAGLRKGLDDERSGLFIEQVRVAKEMRARDEANGRTGVDIRPRYMVWENVPGAFSSNKGDDFRIVLEELAKVKDKDAVIPMPDGGKWTNYGCIMGDGWSIAWRVLDAQFWGVPQRRRRIALVADFGGQSAPEILFVRKGVSGHTDESQPKRKEASPDATGGFGADDCIGVDIYNTAITESKACSLTAGGSGSTGTCPKVMTPIYSVENHPDDSCVGAKRLAFHLLQDPISTEDKAPCLGSGNSVGGQASIGVVLALDRASYNQGKNAQYDFEVSDKGINSSLVAKGPGAVCYSIALEGNGQRPSHKGDGYAETDKSYTLNTTEVHGVAYADVVRTRYIVRRLTPCECELLQGYPKNWTLIGEWTDSNGKKRQTSDAARYKALGNSIALPPWKWVLKRLCACYERDATMASLFDGIGGFPYLWEQINGKGTCLWASEIEEFPIAVTKLRIGGDT